MVAEWEALMAMLGVRANAARVAEEAAAWVEELVEEVATAREKMAKTRHAGTRTWRGEAQPRDQ
jgi:hypothetical protein